MRRSYALLGALLIALATVFSALAEPVEFDPFTQSELDTAWEADRQFPTAGVTSVSAFGRQDVVRIGIDSAQTAAGTFERTEGIKTLDPGNFGDAVQVDLYVDPDWQDKAVRAGFWVVGSDGVDGRDELYGIIEFVNNEPCDPADCSNQANIADHTGWRYWNTATDTWTNVDGVVQYGEWYTLTIALDAAEQEYLYSIDGESIGVGPGGEHYIYGAFLNSYNYGLDNFPTLSSESYSAHWQAGIDYVVGASTYELCVNRYTGQVSSAIYGQCGPLEIVLTTPSEQSLTFCVNPYTGQVSFLAYGSCGRGYRTHVVPDNGDLVTCLNRYTGSMRYVRSLTMCNRYEVPNVIAAA